MLPHNIIYKNTHYVYNGDTLGREGKSTSEIVKVK